MRMAWLLIAGAEAPYFLANRGRFKNPLLPSRAREDNHLNNLVWKTRNILFSALDDFENTMLSVVGKSITFFIAYVAIFVDP